MNTIQTLIKIRNLPEKQVLNWLQSEGIISDLVVTIDDIPECDSTAACRAVVAIINRRTNHTSEAPSH